MWLPPSSRYVLLLGSHFPLRERALVGIRRHLPHHALVDSALAHAEPRMRHYDHVLPANPTVPADVLAAVRDLERRTGSRPAAAVPFSEMTVDVAHAVAEAYDLVRLPEPALARDKLAMKEALARHGLPVAAWVVITDAADLQKAVAEFGFPFVLKANALAGSEGVLFVAGPDDLAPAERRVRDALAKQAQLFPQHPARMFAEPFADHPEYSIEVLNTNGRSVVLSVTDKAVTPLPHFSEAGQSVPGVRATDAAVRETAVEACRALKIGAGVAHVEFRGPLVGEVAARTPADAILDQLERATGLNAYGWHAAAYLGERGPLPEVPPARGTSAVAFLKAPPGRIVDVRRPTHWPANVVRLEVTATPGAVSRPPSDNSAREGLLEMWWPGRFFTGQPPLEHVELARRLAAELFVVAPHEEP